MPSPMPEARQLSEAEIAAFVTDGFVRIDHAFPAEMAAAGRAILWREMGLDEGDPTGWTRPVIRLGMHGEAPFVEAAATPVLVAAYDRLVGRGRWLPLRAMGTFPIRFPSPESPGDDGWHVDMSFGWEQPDFMDWRVNVASRGRALLMLFLFSDVGEDDAPTRIARGSHLEVARLLAPAGDAGLTLRQLTEHLAGIDHPDVAAATGSAGTVYLCHPFLVHAAQPHRGTRPRFLAQPPLLPRGALDLACAPHACSPVETAIRQALGPA